MRGVTLSFLLVASLAAAQNLPSAVKAKLQDSQSQRMAAAQALQAQPATVQPAARKPAAGQPTAAMPAIKAAVVSVRKPKAVQPPVKNAAAAIASVPEKKGKTVIHGRRDPFVSIIQTDTPGRPACSVGKKCLIVDQIVLRGVIKSQNGMLALVENALHKSYFLRDGDPVFNGKVVRITGDSIVFRERVLDRVGRELSRDVVKTLPGSKPAA